MRLSNSDSPSSARGGAVERHPSPPCRLKQRQLSVISWVKGEESRGLSFGTVGRTWTTLRCCCRDHDALLTPHFYSPFVFWSPLSCSPSTSTPIKSSGKMGSRGACSAFLWPCTDSSTRTKSCEWCLHISASSHLSLLLCLWRVKLCLWEHLSTCHISAHIQMCQDDF